MHEILICGSGAGEGIPAAFCGCRVCRNARLVGGKELRLRTAYQLGPEVRIDAGPDFLAQEARGLFDSSRLRHLFLTHGHADHFYPETLLDRSPGASGRHLTGVLHFYGNRQLIDRITAQKIYREHFRTLQLELHPLTAFRPVVLPEEGVTVTPLPANHAPDEDAFFFLVEHCAGNWLIANDTGMFPETVWEFLRNRRLDGVIADCTMGISSDPYPYHMGVSGVIGLYRRLLQSHALKADGDMIANHFSHNGNATYEELLAVLRPAGIRVGYDGMEIPFRREAGQDCALPEAKSGIVS